MQRPVPHRMSRASPSSSSSLDPILINSTVSHDLLDIAEHHPHPQVTPQAHETSFKTISQEQQEALLQQQQQQQSLDACWTPQVLLRPLVPQPPPQPQGDSLLEYNTFDYNNNNDNTTMTACDVDQRHAVNHHEPPLPAHRMSRGLTHDLTHEQQQLTNTSSSSNNNKTSTHKVLMDFVDWWCFKILHAKGQVQASTTTTTTSATNNHNDDDSRMLWRTLVEHEQELHKALENLDDNPLVPNSNNNNNDDDKDNKHYGRLWNRMSLVALSLDVGMMVVGTKPNDDDDNKEESTTNKDLVYSLNLPEPHDHWQLWQEELLMLKSMLLRHDANVDVQQQQPPQASDGETAMPDPAKEQHALFTTEYQDVGRLLQVQHSLTRFYQRLLQLLETAHHKENNLDEDLFQNQIKACVDEYEQDIHKLFGANNNNNSDKNGKKKKYEDDDDDSDEDEDSVGSDIRQLPQPLVGFLLKELYNAQPSRKRLQGPTVLPQRLVHRVEHLMQGSSEYGHAACLERVRTLLAKWHDFVLEEPTLVRLGYGGTVVEDEDDRKRVQAAEAKEDALLRRLSTCGGGVGEPMMATHTAATHTSHSHDDENVSDWEDSEDEPEPHDTQPPPPPGKKDPPAANRDEDEDEDRPPRKRKAIAIEWTDSEEEDDPQETKTKPEKPASAKQTTVMTRRPGGTFSLAARFAAFRGTAKPAASSTAARQKMPLPREEEDDDDFMDYAPLPKKRKPPSHQSQHPHKRLPFTQEEIQAIVEGVKRHGAGNWATIKESCNGRLDRRNTVQIKDKYRNMVRNGEF